MVRNAIVSLASLSLVAFAALPAGALAQSLEFRSTQVSYSDLNLAHDKDVATLFARIQKASVQVCSGAVFGTVADFDAQNRFNSCVANATNHAVASVHSTKLNALHAERTGVAVTEIQTASSH